MIISVIKKAALNVRYFFHEQVNSDISTNTVEFSVIRAPCEPVIWDKPRAVVLVVLT